MRRALALLCLPLLLSGCVPAVVAGGTEAGISASENRTIGRKVDDNLLYTNITAAFVDAKQGDLITDVTFNIRYGRVMLTGRVRSQEDAAKAVAMTWKVEGVQEVINELIIDKDSGFWSTANDAFIKRNLETRLLITKDVWVINYSIDIQNGTAYIIGRVKDRAELDRVLSVARTTKGVKKVISHLQINPDVAGTTPASTAPAAGSSTAPYSPASGPAAKSGSLQDSVNHGPTIVNTSPAYGSTSGTVEAPGSVSSAPLDSPKK